MYKLIRSPYDNEIRTVTKTENGFLISIPFDPANTDYQEYLKWVADGGVPEPADGE
jgi:hypothetical protein